MIASHDKFAVGNHARRLRPIVAIIGLVAALALLAPANASATESPNAFVPPGLLQAATQNPSQVFHVIVVGEPGNGAAKIKNEKMKDVLGNAFGHVRKSFAVVDSVAADLNGADLLKLAAKNGISSITPDAPVAPTSFNPIELWPFAVGVEQLWGATNPNTGVFTAGPQAPAIAVIDSGVEPGRLADFGGRLVASVNLVASSPNAVGDDNGHGTLVAGFAAGGAEAYPGAAPNANIVSLRVVDANGMALTSDVIAAADWLFLHGAEYGVRVANFSLHTGYGNYGLIDPLNLAVRRLWLTGIVVVAAAGNHGPQRMLYAPASDPFVITVGAVDLNQTAAVSDDFNAPWSSYGYTAEGFAKPELAAPGRYVTGPIPPASTLATTFASRVVAPGYAWMSGTSFAAPVVAGAAAQILARHPDWSPDQVKGALMNTARLVPNASSMSVGIGEIDAAAAAAQTAPPNPNAALLTFVHSDQNGRPYLDADAWNAAASTDASWTSASWTSASWTSASWTSASWTSASWTSASYTDASWTSASWTSASWTSASWTSASWTSASWTSASAVE
jgi:serine protease AprX